MKFIDLSAEIAPREEQFPFLNIGLTYHDHQEGAKQAQALLKIPSHFFRNSEGWATETFTNLNTHNVTHIDSPWHYNSQIQGQRSPSIDELPLSWFYHDGVVLDMSSKVDGDAVTVDDVQQELGRIGYTLKPMDIVLMRTGRDAFYHEQDYVFRGCGVSAQATVWLYEQGIRVMGIDAWSWDSPLNLQAQEAFKRQEAASVWTAHQVNLPYAHIERLTNLGALPAFGFKVACFPLKIKMGSAGPTRAVAILPD
jgi:kynurenine formamidase